jgi:hypothetical protein
VRQWPWGEEEKMREEGIIAPFCRAQVRRAVYFEGDVIFGKTENAIDNWKTSNIGVDMISLLRFPCFGIVKQCADTRFHFRFVCQDEIV